jgi:hypothetical protein
VLELTLNGVWGDATGAVPRPELNHVPVRAPSVAGAAYVQQQPIERFLRGRPGARYATLAPGGLEVHVRGVFARSPADWNAAADQRSMVFGLEDVDVYNPTQSLRYWSLLRAVSKGLREPKYNAGYFTKPSPLAFDLLDVGWVIARAGKPELPATRPAITASGWTLYRVPPPPRASVFTSWADAPGAEAALATVTGPGFAPEPLLIVEGWPARSSGGSGGTAVYRATGPQSARVDVTTGSPGVVLVRNIYDPNWRANVDGRPVRILPADYVDQGIPVPAGSHVVDLTYDDPTIGLGLLGSAVSLTLLFGVALVIRVRTRRARASDPEARGPTEPPAAT